MQGMMRRSRAREVALQLLFQRDLNPDSEHGQLERFAKDRLRDSSLQKFCMGLVDGVHSHLTEIDARLGEVAENWRLPRMAVVDRNILRMGTYELLFVPQTPAPAAIDEAIELARRFGTIDSPRFVNGVLDKLKPQETASAESSKTTEKPADADGKPESES
jgi:transcription antitermination protein NusB